MNTNTDIPYFKKKKMYKNKKKVTTLIGTRVSNTLLASVDALSVEMDTSRAGVLRKAVQKFVESEL